MLKERHNKNRGFTLVEVLVAAAILSLVVTPILSSFLSIARVNAKARRKLSATTIANGVMESVKNFELAQVAKECAFQTEGFTLIAGFTGTAKEFSPGTTNIKNPATITKTGDKYVFTASTDGKYAFGFVGVKMDGTTYNVLVTYEKNATTTKEQVKIDTAEGPNKLTKTTREVFSPMGLRVLTYYDVVIKVYRGDNTTFTGTPLAEISGSKADYTN